MRLSLEEQLRLLEEVKGLVKVPIVVVANKADLTSIPEYPSMSTGSGEGVQEILDALLVHKDEWKPKKSKEPEEHQV